MIPAASIQGATILIIDDIPANLGVAVETLEMNGFPVLVAQDGEEGLQRAEFAHPDLILLDVMMPGLDGFEVCRRLKTRPETRDIPVIFLTALGDIRDKVVGFDAGGVDYVTKPFEVTELLARVTTHLALAWAQSRLQEKNRLLEHEIVERQRIGAELDSTLDQLQESEERYRRMVELSSDPILIAVDESIIFSNRAAVSLFRAANADALLGRSLLSLVEPPDRAAAGVILSGLTPGAAPDVRDEIALCLDGNVFDASVVRVAFAHRGKTMIQVVMHDISERVRLTQQLQHQATHDPLTGLPNRLLLMDRLQQAIGKAKRRQEEFCVCFMDVDRFKWINDTYGHDAGDTVLRTVSGRVVSVLRKSDTLARIGGDEFVLILHDPGGADESSEIMSRIVAASVEPIQLAGQDVTVTCSVGCCVFPEVSQSAEGLLEAADKAMYDVKKAKRTASSTTGE